MMIVPRSRLSQKPEMSAEYMLLRRGVGLSSARGRKQPIGLGVSDFLGLPAPFRHENSQAGLCQVSQIIFKLKE